MRTKNTSAPICQNTFSSHLVKQRYDPFQFLPYFTSFCIVKFAKASEKWLHTGEGLGGPLFPCIRHGFQTILEHFCEFLAMRRRYQRPFCNISSIFNLSKHLLIAKKWQIQREGVLTNCNQAKSDGKVVSTQAFASSHEKQFIGQFQLILVLVGSLRILIHSN